MAQGLALDQAAWASPWRSRSVRDKGLLSLGLVLIAISLPPLPAGGAIILVCLVLLLGPIQVGWVRLARISWLPVVSILIGVATVALSISWVGGLQVRITEEGLETAVGLAIRAVAATLAMFTLACSTPMIDLLGALRRARIPDPLIEVAALTYRFTFGLLASVGAIRAAQEARLGYVSRSAATRSAALGVSVLFLRAWDRARRLEAGLASRGYEDALHTLEPERRRSWVFLAATALGLLVLVSGSLILGASR